jgi:hypothetical protein
VLSLDAAVLPAEEDEGGKSNPKDEPAVGMKD